MDFVTPVLFVVLAFLAILVYVRLGNLISLVKETNDIKSKKISLPESSNRIRVFVINAKQGSDAQTIIVKQDVSGTNLHSSIISTSVKRIFINGGAFEVIVSEDSVRDGFILKLTPCAYKSPFPSETNSNSQIFDSFFRQYYCLCF